MSPATAQDMIASFRRREDDLGQRIADLLQMAVDRGEPWTDPLVEFAAVEVEGGTVRLVTGKDCTRRVRWAPVVDCPCAACRKFMEGVSLP